MKKRLLAMMMAGMMVFPMTVSAENAEDITLTVVWNGTGETKDLLDETLMQYTEQTGIKVETTFLPGSWAEYCTKLQTMIAGGDVMDVVYFAIEGYEMFYDSGVLEPIDDWISRNQEKYDAISGDTFDFLNKSVVYQDQIYGFPFDWNNVVVHMNTDRLAEAGLEVPEASWTKEDFLEYCEKLTYEKDGVKKYALCVQADEYFVMEGWLRAFGAKYMNDDFTKSTINSPEAVECLQFLQDLIHKYGYAPIPESSTDEIQYMMDGTSAMGCFGRWPTTNYAANGFDAAAIQHLPSFNENRTYVYGTGGAFVLNSTEYYDAACELAAFIGSADFARGYLSANSIPVQESNIVEIVDGLGYPQNSKLFYEGLDTLAYETISAPIQFDECCDVALRAFSEILVNNSDVQSTLDAAAAEMDFILLDNAE